MLFYHALWQTVRRGRRLCRLCRPAQIFRAPARPTFANSGKSRQKRQKEPPVPSPPGALYVVRICQFLPHVHASFSFSHRQKDHLCSCAAAAEWYREGHCAPVERRGVGTPPYGRPPIEFHRARCPRSGAKRNKYPWDASRHRTTLFSLPSHRISGSGARGKSMRHTY